MIYTVRNIIPLEQSLVGTHPGKLMNVNSRFNFKLSKGICLWLIYMQRECYEWEKNAINAQIWGNCERLELWWQTIRYVASGSGLTQLQATGFLLEWGYQAVLRGRDYYFYYRYLTKITNITPNTVSCACVSGIHQTWGRSVTFKSSLFLSFFNSSRDVG